MNKLLLKDSTFTKSNLNNINNFNNTDIIEKNYTKKKQKMKN